MTTEEMLAEILTRLEKMNAQLHSLVEPSTSSSYHPPTSTPFVDIDIEDREHEATILVAASSSRAATPSSPPPAPSLTSPSAPPWGVDPMVFITSTDAGPPEPIHFPNATACNVARQYLLPSDHRGACSDELWCMPGRIVEEFQMEQSLPPYLFAFAAGGVEFRDLDTHALAIHSASASTTSAPSQDGFQMGVTDLLTTSPTRCSTLAPCHDACIPVSGYNSSATPTSSPTLVPPLDVSVFFTGELAMVPLSSPTPFPSFTLFQEAGHAPSAGSIKLCLGTGSPDTHEMFEVMSSSPSVIFEMDSLVHDASVIEKVLSENTDHISLNECTELQQPWPPPPAPFLTLGYQFNLWRNQFVVERGGLQPKPPRSLDDTTNYDQSKHVWLLLLDSWKQI